MRLEKTLCAAERRPWAILTAVIGAQLALGVGYSLYLGDDLRYHDEREYLALAEGLVERGEFAFRGLRAFRPPGYPFVLAGLVSLGASVVALRIANFVLLAVATFLLYRVVTSFARRAAGLLASLWVLAYPVLFYAAGTLYPQTLGGCLLTGILATLAAPGPLTWLKGAAAGLMFSFLVLTVPIFAPQLGIILLWSYRSRRRVARGYCAAMVFASILPVFVWTLRNRAVLEEWVPVSTNLGVNLVLGNSDHTTPNSGVNARVGDDLARARDLPEVARDRFYRRMALNWIISHPEQALRLYTGKLLHNFGTDDQLATASERDRLRSLLLFWTYLPLLLAPILRLVLAARRPLHPTERLLITLYITTGMVQALVFTRVRFRLPADYLAIALSASAVISLVESRTRSLPKKAAEGNRAHKGVKTAAWTRQTDPEELDVCGRGGAKGELGRKREAFCSSFLSDAAPPGACQITTSTSRGAKHDPPCHADRTCRLFLRRTGGSKLGQGNPEDGSGPERHLDGDGHRGRWNGRRGHDQAWG